MTMGFKRVLLLAALAALPSFGQTLGEITGVVTDTTGAVTIGVTVTASNSETGLVRSTATNDSGNYAFPALNPGVYSVKAEMRGFATEIHTNIVLQVQQVARIDFQLRVGAVGETIEVSGGAPLLTTDTVTLGTVIENQLSSNCR